MTERAPLPEGESLASLVGDYRRALSALQDLTEELAARLLSGALETDGVGPASSQSRDVLEITCLGTFSVRFHGRRVELPAAGRPAAVLRLLADRGGLPVPRDELIELLWPGVPTAAGVNRLRVAVHGLRQAFGEDPDIVLFESGAYRLNAPRVRVDVEEFELLVREGRRLAQIGDVEGARHAYVAAERLYRGDYVRDDSVEEWAANRRQHLRDLYLNVLVKLALLAVDGADYDACVGYGHALVREDPLSEDAYRLLMLGHARLGNRSRALRWYELCEQALGRELGLAPSVATVQLREEIRSDEADSKRSNREQLGLAALGW